MDKQTHRNSAILLVHCPDQKGIVSAITSFIFKNDGNIIYLDQHVDYEGKVFFMRIEWELDHFLIPDEKIADYFNKRIGKKYQMTFQLFFSRNIPKVAIFVSRLSHCLYDILARWQDKEWRIEIPLMISNHKDLSEVAGRFGIPFHYFPVNKENKVRVEKKEIELLHDSGIDFIILARYMQVLSDTLVSKYTNRIINIHHSFLPSFPGAKPYHSAFERGVKMVGATSHYVTCDLDAGPIIDQDVVRITQKDSVQDIIRKGQDLEKIVLARAVYAHFEHRLLVYRNKTIVFS